MIMIIILIIIVGYGDITPQTKEGKVFCIFYMLASVIVVGSAISNYAEISADVSKINKRLKAFNDLNVCKMVENNWGSYGKNDNQDNHENQDDNYNFNNNELNKEDWFIDKSHFLAFMLCETNDIDRADIDPILMKFDQLLAMQNTGESSNKNYNKNNNTLKEADIRQFAQILKNREKAATVTAYSGLPVVWNSIKKSFQCLCGYDSSYRDNEDAPSASNSISNHRKSNISSLFEEHATNSSNQDDRSRYRSSSQDSSHSNNSYTFTHTSRGTTVATSTTTNTNRRASALLGGVTTTATTTTNNNNSSSSSDSVSLNSEMNQASKMEEGVPEGVCNPMNPMNTRNTRNTTTSTGRSTTGTAGTDATVGGFSNDF